MSRTTLQIPVDTMLRKKAEKAASAAGFSSVQEVVRVFLKKFASQTIDVSFYDTVVLSKKAEQRYASMVADAKREQNVVKFKSSDELLSILD